MCPFSSVDSSLSNLENPQQNSQGDHRSHELPHRYAGRPGDHQFMGPGQAPERIHAAEKNSEGKHLLAHIGELQKRHFHHQGEGDARPGGGPAQKLDGVKNQDQKHEQGENNGEAQQEVAADI